jgi:hypothetical protein
MAAIFILAAVAIFSARVRVTRQKSEFEIA